MKKVDRRNKKSDRDTMRPEYDFSNAKRGVTQTFVLNQTTPQPIVASVWSRASGVTGGRDHDYALFLDLLYTDGTPLWGQVASFDAGTHDWQRQEVTVLPEKPIKRLSYYLLLRGHGGRAEFRDAELRIIETPAGACVFEGVPVLPQAPPVEGFQIRDVAAGSDFVHLDREALGLKLAAQRSGNFVEATLTNTTGKDRAVTLIYALPVAGDGWRWLAGPRRSEATVPGREYSVTHNMPVGQGRLSRWPFAAIARSALSLRFMVGSGCAGVIKLDCATSIDAEQSPAAQSAERTILLMLIPPSRHREN